MTAQDSLTSELAAKLIFRCDDTEVRRLALIAYKVNRLGEAGRSQFFRLLVDGLVKRIPEEERMRSILRDQPTA